MAYGTHHNAPAERVLEVTAASLLGVNLVSSNYGAARAIMVMPEIDAGSDWTTAIAVTITTANGSSISIPLAPGTMYPISIRSISSIGSADTVYLFW